MSRVEADAIPFVPTAVVAATVGPNPQNCRCHSCNQNITTRIVTENTKTTHLIALVLCCCLCWPCAWIPYCVDACKSKTHYCPNCNTCLGTYSK